MSVISYIIAFVVIAQFIIRIKRRQQSRVPQNYQPRPQTVEQQPQQSAYDWIFGEGRTEEYKDFGDEDWIKPVEPTVQDEIRTIGESQHDIVHESVHETVHVRQRRPEAPATVVAPQPQPLRLDKHALAQAILLSEALGEPRSKRPWRPNRSN